VWQCRSFRLRKAKIRRLPDGSSVLLFVSVDGYLIYLWPKVVMVIVRDNDREEASDRGHI